MTSPEFSNDVLEKIATDPRVVGYLHRVVQMGLAEFDLETEIELATELTATYGIDVATFGDACAIAIDRIDH